MAKWTPGPWELSYDQGSTRDVISTKGSLPICTMRLSWITHEQYAANALLVAAAPELADALSEMIAAMVDYEMEAETEAPASHREMMRKARAALAKANGGGNG